jgi:hypothetical protein
MQLKASAGVESWLSLRDLPCGVPADGGSVGRWDAVNRVDDDNMSLAKSNACLLCTAPHASYLRPLLVVAPLHAGACAGSEWAVIGVTAALDASTNSLFSGYSSWPRMPVHRPPSATTTHLPLRHSAGTPPPTPAPDQQIPGKRSLSSILSDCCPS